jgi:threonine synthase
MEQASRLACVLCTNSYPLDGDRYACECGGLLDVVHDWSALRFRGESLRAHFLIRRWHLESPADVSGVWRFRDCVMPGLSEAELVMRGEGNTRLYEFQRTNRWLDLPGARFKHEGENPTGSFKDRGMTVAMTWAKRCGAKIVACASTGNTSASVASYAALAGIPAVILISEKGTALGKVAQSLAYGATTVKIRGDFDEALKLLLAARDRFGLTVMNSVNPVRLEGQKTVMWEAFEQLKWNAPDWVVVPAGNLGNAAAFGKAIKEAYDLGLITRRPRIAMVQAAGANPLWLAQHMRDGWKKRVVRADTIATAIKIGAPVNFDKAVRTIRETDGVVVQVDDREIMDAKAVLDSDGVGAEPASCAAAAGLKKLVDTGIVRRDDTVVAVLTGHMLKDPDATVGYHSGTLAGIPSTRANAPVVIDADLASFENVLARLGGG